MGVTMASVVALRMCPTDLQWQQVKPTKSSVKSITTFLLRLDFPQAPSRQFPSTAGILKQTHSWETWGLFWLPSLVQGLWWPCWTFLRPQGGQEHLHPTSLSPPLRVLHHGLHLSQPSQLPSHVLWQMFALIIPLHFHSILVSASQRIQNKSPFLPNSQRCLETPQSRKLSIHVKAFFHKCF